MKLMSRPNGLPVSRKYESNCATCTGRIVSTAFRWIAHRLTWTTGVSVPRPPRRERVNKFEIERRERLTVAKPYLDVGSKAQPIHEGRGLNVAAEVHLIRVDRDTAANSRVQLCVRDRGKGGKAERCEHERNPQGCPTSKHDESSWAHAIQNAIRKKRGRTPFTI